MSHDAQTPLEGWAIIELFGHNKIAGYVTTAMIGTSGMLRVDVPEMDDSPAYTRFYRPGAVYSLTLVTEELVRAALKYAHPEPLAKGRAMLERVKAAGEDPRVQKTNECMFGNPGYHSSETPRMELLLNYFGHDKTLPEFQQGLIAWADYILPILCGPQPLKGAAKDE